MKIPYVTTCCCLFSVHMGALLIVYVNNFLSFLAFVSWATHAFSMYQRLRHNHVNYENEHTALVWIIVAFGFILIILHVNMSIAISRGLHKDEPRYLRAYMRMGYAALFLNTCNTVMTFFVHNTEFITVYGSLFYSWLFIPLQCYFMLVIRSTIKEMVQTQNVLSSSRNEPV